MTKKLFTTAALLFLLLISLLPFVQTSAQTANTLRTVVSGQISNASTLRSVAIVINANPFSQQPFKFEGPTDANGNFKITFDLPVGLLGILQAGQGNVPIYMEPGDSIGFTAAYIGNGFNNPSFGGKGSINNNALIAYYQAITPAGLDYKPHDKVRTLNAKAYRAYTDSIRNVFLGHFNTIKKNNAITAGAENMFLSRINYPWGYALLDYPGMNARLNNRNTYNIEGDYFSFLNEIPVMNDGSIFIKEYTDFVDKFITERFALEVINAKPDYDLEMMYADKYDYAKKVLQGEAFNFAACKAILEGFTQGRLELIKPKYEDFIQTCKRLEYVDAAKWFYNQLKHLEAGQTAPDFRLKTVDGKEVAISDFKGKVVYMDFWATWCGPCKQQLPHSKVLKQQLEGKDIVFLYVSTDTAEDRWKKMVADEQLPGVHVIAGSSGIAGKYNVTGIPKYFLIGKDGKIISSHARRPSDKRTKEMLEAATLKN